VSHAHSPELLSVNVVRLDVAGRRPLAATRAVQEGGAARVPGQVRPDSCVAQGDKWPKAAADKWPMRATADKWPMRATADKWPMRATADKWPKAAADKWPMRAAADTWPMAA
jgi:hypothetical protein